jgi:hypothetical protein
MDLIALNQLPSQMSRFSAGLPLAGTKPGPGEVPQEAASQITGSRFASGSCETPPARRGGPRAPRNDCQLQNDTWQFAIHNLQSSAWPTPTTHHSPLTTHHTPRTKHAAISPADMRPSRICRALIFSTRDLRRLSGPQLTTHQVLPSTHRALSPRKIVCVRD